jgi:hypothetical protein
VLSLRQVKGRWRSIEVLVTRDGHRLARKRLKRVRMPAKFSVEVPAGATPLQWTVLLRQGRRIERAIWTVTANAPSLAGRAHAQLTSRLRALY